VLERDVSKERKGDSASESETILMKKEMPDDPYITNWSLLVSQMMTMRSEPLLMKSSGRASSHLL